MAFPSNHRLESKGTIVKMFCHLQLCPRLGIARITEFKADDEKKKINNILTFLAGRLYFQNSLLPLAIEAQTE